MFTLNSTWNYALTFTDYCCSPTLQASFTKFTNTSPPQLKARLTLYDVNIDTVLGRGGGHAGVVARVHGTGVLDEQLGHGTGVAVASGHTGATPAGVVT